MLPNTLGRALCLGMIIATTKIYGAIILIMLFVSQLMISCLESVISKGSVISKTRITSKMFLGILTSFTSPCLIVIEQSKHFLVNGISGTILNIIATWSIYLLVSTHGKLFPEALEYQNNITSNSTIKYHVNTNINGELGTIASTFELEISTRLELSTLGTLHRHSTLWFSQKMAWLTL